MIKKGYNPNQIAKMIGAHRCTVYNHINNNCDLGIQKAKKIAKILDVTIDEVYAEK